MTDIKAKFIVDGMLGKLARWLRIFGFDTEYFSGKDKYFLLWKARKEGRIILTRDHNLFIQNQDICIFIESEDLKHQVRQIKKDVGIVFDNDLFFSRCNVCNRILEHKNLSDVIDNIPEYVARTHRDFSYCRSCGRIYWRGTHYERMLKFIESIQSDED